jgi:hypothetical protein
MTSSGSNTWSVPLEINNLESQVAGNIVNGVSSITAGGGISVNASTGAVTVNNTGVISLTQVGGLAITGSNNLSIKNTGVLSATAGSNISITGGTGGTGDIVISATPVLTGVTSIVAGSNITISPVGGTGAVTINSTPTSVVSNGKVSASNFEYDGTGSAITLTASQIGNAFIFCNTVGSQAQTLYLPNVTALTAQFGSNAVVNFFIGELNVTIFNPLFPNIALSTLIVSPTGNEYWANNYTTQAPTSPLTVSGWTSYSGSPSSSASVHFPALYKVQVTIQGGKAFYYFDYAGFNFP